MTDNDSHKPTAAENRRAARAHRAAEPPSSTPLKTPRPGPCTPPTAMNAYWTRRVQPFRNRSGYLLGWVVEDVYGEFAPVPHEKLRDTSERSHLFDHAPFDQWYVETDADALRLVEHDVDTDDVTDLPRFTTRAEARAFFTEFITT